jgi:hypothetical protein
MAHYGGGEHAMIFKRAVAKLRAQDWMAISIELTIVIVGVFIAMWVANWNEQRAERREAESMVAELRPGLLQFDRQLELASQYFRVANRYGDTAFSGWAVDPKVSDEQFVIAAYQASQVTQIAMNGGSWTQIYGGDKLSRLPDRELRSDLAGVMALDFSQLTLNNVATAYRQHVREVIPQDIQDAIREHCGDASLRGVAIATLLPSKCELDFPAEKWAAAARDLRSEPRLVKELRWHRAAVATFVFMADLFRIRVERALDRIDIDAPPPGGTADRRSVSERLQRELDNKPRYSGGGGKR